MTLAPRLVFPTIGDDDGDDYHRVSRFDVERYHCGELAKDRRAVVAAAIDNDPALQAFLAELTAADAAFVIEHPVALLLAKRPAPSLWSRLLRSSSMLRLPALASAVAAVALVVAVVNRPVDREVVDSHRTKGGHHPVVGFFVKSGDGARVGTAGEVLHAGDQIQLAVTDADKRAVAVVGIDGSGAVSVYAAETIGTHSKGHDGPRVLPTSLILDDTAGAERFFVV